MSSPSFMLGAVITTGSAVMLFSVSDGLLLHTAESVGSVHGMSKQKFELPWKKIEFEKIKKVEY